MNIINWFRYNAAIITNIGIVIFALSYIFNFNDMYIKIGLGTMLFGTILYFMRWMSNG